MPVAAIQGIKVPRGSIVSLDPFLETKRLRWLNHDLGDELPHGVKHGADNIWRLMPRDTARSDLVLPARDAFGSFRLVSFVGKFRLYPRYQLVKAGTGEDTVKLGAVVIHEADVFDY
jgi:hypothetical protein